MLVVLSWESIHFNYARLKDGIFEREECKLAPVAFVFRDDKM